MTRLSRASLALFASTCSLLPMLLAVSTEAVAQDPSPLDAPTRAVGDRWTYNFIVKPTDTCTDGIPSGAQMSETVTSVGDIGYVTEIAGPYPNDKYLRRYANDGSYAAIVDGTDLRSRPVVFPLKAGAKWESTLVTPRTVTKLDCRASAAERLKVGSEELDVVPVVCDGRWTNRQTGNGDMATVKYWYSPIVGATVRYTHLTWNRGRRCADQEYSLATYPRKKSE